MSNRGKSEIGGCLFCHPENLPEEYTRHFPDYGLPSRLDLMPVIETETLLVKPDLVPVHPGGLHFLMIPKDHKLAYGEAANGSLQLVHDVGWIMRRLEQEFGTKFLYAEHGGGLPELGYEESKVQSVYHLHAHLVSADGFDLIRYMEDALRVNEGILEMTGNVDSDENPATEVAQFYTGHPSLYFQLGRRGLWVEDNGDIYPSQITQRNLSRFYGPEVDWKTIPQNSQMARFSAQRIMSLVSRCRI